MTDFIVKASGPLSLIQDKGRFEHQHLGLTTGGVADVHAYYWLNRLLSNDDNASCIEVTLGGLILVCQSSQMICLTGASSSLMINKQQKRMWCCHLVHAGDVISIGYANSGVRAYLGVKHGFDIALQFGSTSTVVREKVGGLFNTQEKSGQPLAVNDELSVKKPVNINQSISSDNLFALGDKDIPRYQNSINLRLVLGYQHADFGDVFKQHFFSTTFEVSKDCDRMGYRLIGGELSHQLQALPSEGICFGAVQIPPDGKPIVLLNDRQTLGGYPKIGSVLSIDAYKLMQARQGTIIHFEVISVEQAISALRECQHNLESIYLKQVMPSINER